MGVREKLFDFWSDEFFSVGCVLMQICGANGVHININNFDTQMDIHYINNFASLTSTIKIKLILTAEIIIKRTESEHEIRIAKLNEPNPNPNERPVRS